MVIKSKNFAMTAAICCSLAYTALAQDPVGIAPATKGLLPIPDFSGDLWLRPRLAGDFNGGRSQLAERGVHINVDWTQIGQAIVDGGRDTDNAYGGKVDTLIKLDLMRMGVLDGALLTIRAESRYGESINGAAGPILPVNTDGFFPLTNDLDEGICVNITNLNYTQFLSEKLAVFGGKIDTLDGDLNEFASGRGTSQFLNAAFVFNPVSALRLPYSTLGAGMLVLPSENVSIKAAILNTIDSSNSTGFDDFGDGVTASVEASFQYRLGDLPGGATLAGLYSWDQNFAQVNGELIFVPGQGLAVPNEDDTWAVFANMWQYIWVEDSSDKPINTSNGVPDRQGVGVFGRLGFADEDTNPIEWAASVGVGGRGLIPGRDHDSFGVGYSYTKVQDTLLTGLLGIEDRAQAAEAFYNVAITPAVNLTFDAQVAESPFPNADTALILGMRLNIRF